MTVRSVAQLKAELREAEQAEAAAKKQRLLDTPVQYRYQISPTSARGHFEKLYDDTCVRYQISRTVLNMDEAKAVGHHDWDLAQGGMTYIYNKVTCRIIGSQGGGNAYISDTWNGPSDGADDIAFQEIGYFLEANPAGGDITYIVENYQEARKG